MKCFVKGAGALALAALLGAASQAGAKIAVDPALPDYQAAAGLTGSLNSVGSDTLNNVMTLWAERFQQLYPGVKIQIEGKGSATAPPALIAGTAQLGPMSREMKSTEVDDFVKKYGYKPTQVKVALDALSVFLNRDNPVGKLTLPEVDAIFSKTRRGGHREISNWSDLGGANEAITLYGRNSASGTYAFFKENALFGGDYKNEVQEQPGSASVVSAVGRDKAGIGYSGMGYRTSAVKAARIAKEQGGEYVAATAANVYNGKYPLKRYLYIYVNKAPGKDMDPLVAEFVKFALSKQGQEYTIKDGFLPLPASVASAAIE